MCLRLENILKVILTVVFACFIHLTNGQPNGDWPKEVDAVFNYMLKKDFPEVFNGDPFQFRPVRWVVTDIDEDGTKEVFLQTFPHYRPSPTVTIFQIDEKDSVKRLTEALAPGHLEAIAPERDYFDTHTTRTAVDMQLGSSDPAKLAIFAKASLKFGMSAILFRNFIHTDKRDGDPVFLDLTYLVDYAGENSCANFQFAFPDNLVAGRVNGSQHKYLIAQVKDDLFCYEILGFTEEGWINKNITVIKLPADFENFHVVEESIKYLSKRGKVKKFEM